jgi:Flp pilus assembly protein TadD
MRRLVGLIIFSMLLLAGCNTTQQARNTPVETRVLGPSVELEIPLPAKQPETTLVEQNRDAAVFALNEETLVEMQMTSPIDQLTDEAEREQRQGNLSRAVTILERALRIEPRNPHLWNRLAQMHLQQKSFKLAGDLAARSNALTKKGAAIRHDNWLIIADVRRTERDFSGAEEAENRAATLQ